MSNILNNPELAKYANPDHSIYFIKEIYKNCIDADPAWMVEVRKIGQYTMQGGATASAEQSTAAQLLQFDQANWIDGLAQWVARQVILTAPVGIGTFMAPALLNDRRATDQSVVMLTTVCADFDTGNPEEKLNALCLRLGARPTLVCTSGGTTKDGYPKLHAHWRLDEPCMEPWKVAYIREQLAHLYGADDSFKRIPQIIRIPGALYDKQGQWGTTLIIEHTDNDVGLMQWEDALEIDWNNLAEDSMFNKAAKQRKTKEERAERMRQLQTEEVTEGRITDTRWDRFSEYAGHQIRQARFQHQTIDEALISVKIWVNDKMVPAWEDDRVEAEFRALLQRDRANHEDVWADHGKPPIIFGNASVIFNEPITHALPSTTNSSADSGGKTEEALTWSLKTFDVADYYAGPAPAERHLIQNFLVHGSNVALIADGGVGKTYLCLELGLRAAAGPNHSNNNFMGFNILEKCQVIIFTVEDGKDDIHRRICAIDQDGTLRAAAKGNCSIIPVQEEIMDGLMLVERDPKGNMSASRAWKAMQSYIESYLEDHKQPGCEQLPLLVIIDTYSATHHGDENSSVGANEWFRSAALLKKFKATLLVTHHIRKTDPKFDIRTPNDMRLAVRGSTAFMNSLRFVVGVWAMPNDRSVLNDLPDSQHERLYNMAPLKNNTGISWKSRSDERFPDPVITLSRNIHGQLYYDDQMHLKRLEISEAKQQKTEFSRTQLAAALTHLVKVLSQGGYPPSQRQLVEEKNIFLPDSVNRVSKAAVKSELDSLIKEGILVRVRGMVPRGFVLDIQNGPYSSGASKERVPNYPKVDWKQFVYNADVGNYDKIINPLIETSNSHAS